MNQRFHLSKLGKATAALAGLAALLTGCRHDAVVLPAYDDYFPTVVGTYRTYAVVDSTWTNGVVTTSQYQFRERVAEQFTDAAGQPAYRLFRSRRVSAAATWVDDSVFVVQPLARAVLLTRSNVRTVELIYPPTAGKKWNRDAFTVNGQAATTNYNVVDTITSLTRYYGPVVGAAYTTAAAGGAAAKTYDATVTVADVMPTQINDSVLRRSGYQQVFAKGVGLVLRRHYYYETFIKGSNGSETPTSTVRNGTSRRETLLETGKL